MSISSTSLKSLASRFQVLSEHPLIIEAKEFITEAECQTLLNAARKRVHEPLLDPDDKRKFNFDPACFTRGSLEWRLMQDICSKVDILLDTPHHQDEQGPVVHFTPPTFQSDQRMTLGMHLDTNHKPMRFATAILYLASLPEASDGATVFPCANALRDGYSELSKDNELFRNAYELVFGTKDGLHAQTMCFQHTGPALRSTDNTGSCRAAEELLAACEDSDVGVNVRPEAGKLCIFFSRGMHGDVDPLSLHGGAAVLNNIGADSIEGKWTMQYFREAPRPDTWTGKLKKAASGSGGILPEVENFVSQYAAAVREKLLDGIRSA
eukprot:gnl/MRDRNA2_/MRDRNA2_122636_c0_seq1.p1 gnl/MRDRNA2_/MRDRNA2_122636_c0~~gnl/MRDRNA2_/MRDRNA2_122636_c0_seq1.p1  ORF type:complete len:323 (-),score=51.15 gnl/MRDRNA2_/MRDRNA2_122636_c0_seq1:93-1061(-)